MELSEEMKKNGWVTETDEDGQTYTYNKKFFNDFLNQPKTDSPLISANFVIFDVTKPKDK